MARRKAPKSERRGGQKRRRGSGKVGNAATAVVTEMQSMHSMAIDEYGPIEIVRATRACEGELFSGFQGYPSLRDASMHKKLESAARMLSDAVNSKGGKALVVFSGAGTSGRLCWAACELMKDLAKLSNAEIRCECSLAGGNRAFKKAVEHAEDDEASASAALDQIVAANGLNEGEGPSNIILVGVTCGMSATWVASQIGRTLDLGGKAVLLGFTPFEGCRGLFAEPQVRERLTGNEEEVIILDPVVGPELVTGSTRLKSGTATKVCLEVIILLAFRQTSASSSTSKWWGGMLWGGAKGGITTRKIMQEYEEALKIYNNSQSLMNPFNEKMHPLSVGAASLQRHGRIVYGGYGREGLLGIIDASEQLPTFGCLEEDFQGFLLDSDVSKEVLRVIGTERTLPKFKEVLATLGEDDTLVLVLNFRRISDFGGAELARAKNTLSEIFGGEEEKRAYRIISLAAVPRVSNMDEATSDLMQLVIESSDSIVDIFLDETSGASVLSRARGDNNEYDLGAEIAIKSALNCFSSGANILNGKVFTNVMIDVRISNKKLLERAIKIVMTVAKVERLDAMESIMTVLGMKHLGRGELERLHSVHGHVDPAAHFSEKDLLKCIELGSQMRKVVPMAVLLASGKCSQVGEARALLDKASEDGRTLRDIIKDTV
ncbi:glucokinase regulatory protein [Chloropicon primus]|nr:glucokinase regulatory protein [Chloropicon primus]